MDQPHLQIPQSREMSGLASQEEGPGAISLRSCEKELKQKSKVRYN